MKVVINRCYGGFSLSEKAILRYAEIKGIKLEKVEDGYWSCFVNVDLDDDDPDKHFYDRGLKRNDPALIQVVEELGEDADGSCASLRITEIPDSTNWQIDEYDGMECVEEVHQRWY